MSDPTIHFTEHERKRVEEYFGTPWEELSEAGKVMRGLIYRHTLSPEAIAKQIIGDSKHEKCERDGERGQEGEIHPLPQE